MLREGEEGLMKTTRLNGEGFERQQPPGSEQLLQSHVTRKRLQLAPLALLLRDVGAVRGGGCVWAMIDN